MDPTARTTIITRGWGAATALLGVVMMVRPDRVAALVAGSGTPPHPAIVRLLGGRQVAQGAAVLATPDSRTLLVSGSVVDLLHGASMVGAALVWPRFRTPALASAVLAVSSAAVGGIVGREPGTRETRRWHR